MWTGCERLKAVTPHDEWLLPSVDFHDLYLALLDDLLQQAEQHISVDGALMGLVKDDDAVPERCGRVGE